MKDLPAMKWEKCKNSAEMIMFAKGKVVADSKDLHYVHAPDSENYFDEACVLLFEDGSGILIGTDIEYGVHESEGDSINITWYKLTPESK